MGAHVGAWTGLFAVPIVLIPNYISWIPPLVYWSMSISATCIILYFGLFMAVHHRPKEKCHSHQSSIKHPWASERIALNCLHFIQPNLSMWVTSTSMSLLPWIGLSDFLAIKKGLNYQWLLCPLSSNSAGSFPNAFHFLMSHLVGQCHPKATSKWWACSSFPVKRYSIKTKAAVTEVPTSDDSAMADISQNLPISQDVIKRFEWHEPGLSSTDIIGQLHLTSISVNQNQTYWGFFQPIFASVYSIGLVWSVKKHGKCGKTYVL